MKILMLIMMAGLVGCGAAPTPEEQRAFDDVVTASPTVSPDPSPEPSPSPSVSPSPAASPSPSASPTAQPSPTQSASPSPSVLMCAGIGAVFCTGGNLGSNQVQLDEIAQFTGGNPHEQITSTWTKPSNDVFPQETASEGACVYATISVSGQLINVGPVCGKEFDVSTSTIVVLPNSEF